MRVALGADHAGYQLKEALKRVLTDLGVEHQDFGASSALSVDYPDFAHAVAKGVAAGAFDRGILVCGSGIGMSIAANKVTGIRAAPIVDTETARLAREHNDLNARCSLHSRIAREGNRSRVPANAVRRGPARNTSRKD